MRDQLRTFAIAAAIVGQWIYGASVRGESAAFMLRAVVDGQELEGQPLAWSREHVLLLGRDGALRQFAPDEAKDAKKSGRRFAPYTSSEISGRLRTEFDRSYGIATTKHFVVVHPRGRYAAWADRLESLFKSFSHYMSVRGFAVEAPPAPLTAVVFRNEAAYFEHAAKGGTVLQPGTMGHYDPMSNRMFLFDADRGDGIGDWAANSETIIHECAHQTAYNIGVHNRFADQPRWLVEGLAMMFEARGVWNAASLRSQTDRLNLYRLRSYRKGASDRPADWIVRLVASDQEFEIDVLDAYAEAWTLTFYLCETRPQEYCRYLARTSQRRLFSEYPPEDRMADFTGVFGRDLDMLAAQVERFVSELP